MAMSTGAKVAIGCGIVVALGGVAAVTAIGVGAWWLKGKAEKAAGGLQKITAKAEEIEAWEKRANANPFARPPDGVIPEARLIKFLDVRRAVYAVYERYHAEIDALRQRSEAAGEPPSPSELLSMGGKLAEMTAEIRLAQMRALAREGMSEAEYRYLQLAVYKSAWASATEKATGKMPAEAVSEASRQLQEAMRAAAEKARQDGVPGADKLSASDVESLGKSVNRMGEGGAELLEVPKANVELFRKHEAQIMKYAMHGLAFLGL